MYYDIQNFVDFLLANLSLFYHSTFMLVVKIFIGIYLLILLVDIVLMLILRNVPQHLRVGLKGTDLPLVSKKKMKKRWDKVRARLNNSNPSQYKVAIIEADKIAEEILDGIGYKGANMTEKLEQVGEAHLDDHLEALKGAHEIRNKIIHQADYEISHEAAEAVVGVYENFLKYLEFME